VPSADHYRRLPVILASSGPTWLIPDPRTDRRPNRCAGVGAIRLRARPGVGPCVPHGVGRNPCNRQTRESPERWPVDPTIAGTQLSPCGVYAQPRVPGAMRSRAFMRPEVSWPRSAAPCCSPDSSPAGRLATVEAAHLLATMAGPVEAIAGHRYCGGATIPEVTDERGPTAPRSWRCASRRHPRARCRSGRISQHR